MASPPVPIKTGWTRSQLIDVADRRTDRRASKKLDLDGEFLAALQEFCLERRWPWTRKTTRFTLTPNVFSYDMLDPLGLNMPDYHLIGQHGMKVIKANGDKSWVEPEFDTDMQEEYLDDTLTLPNIPTAYYILPQFALNLHPIPDLDYDLRIFYWACPNVVVEDQSDTIPLVPGYLHHVLLKKLELQILRFTIGEGAAKYQAVAAEYTRLLEHHMMYMENTPGRVLEWRDQDSNDFVKSSTS